MAEAEMEQLAAWICTAIAQREDEPALRRLAAEVERFCLGYPVPGLSEPGEAVI